MNQNNSNERIIAIICEVYSYETFVIENKICCKWLNVLRRCSDDETHAQEIKVAAIHHTWIEIIRNNYALWLDLLNTITKQTSAIAKLATADIEYKINCDKMLDGEITYVDFKSIFVAGREYAQLSKFNTDARFEVAKNKLLNKLLAK